jgi:hypothetical protein
MATPSGKGTRYKMRIISVFISYNFENENGKELKEFFDKVEILRRIPCEIRLGTIYQISHERFPKINEGDVLKVYDLKIHYGEFFNGISL